MCFTRVGSGLTREDYTRLERPAREKYSSLLRQFVNYGGEKIINIVHRANIIKLFTAVSYKFS
jgi:hypothetical protein